MRTDAVGQPTPRSIQAAKPLRVSQPVPLLRYFSVEQVNIQMDEHRWWSIAVAGTRDEAMRLFRQYRTEDPEGIYRVIEAAQIA